MELLAFFSLGRDIDSMTESDWESMAGGGEHPCGAEKIGCYDEAALEYALRIKDEAATVGVECALTAVTVGAKPGIRISRALFALGFGRVAALECEREGEFGYVAPARAVAAFAREKKYDAILMAQQDPRGGGEDSPALIASLTGMGCVGYVCDLRFDEDGELRVSRVAKRGEAEAIVREPAVYALFNAKHPYLRVATLRETLAAASKEPEISFADGGGAEPEGPRLVSLGRIKTERRCSYIAEDVPHNGAREIRARAFGEMEGAR